MKKSIFLIVLLLCALNIFAQTPQKMSYQAVIRNNASEVVAMQNIGVKLSILRGSPTGTEVFAESHSTTTNENGLITLEIGSGTAITSTLAEINWANGPYYIKSETDLTGGSNYTLSGSYQLLSVPYALYAYSAGTLNSHYIGELYGGGIIVSLWKDNLGEPHGLIASLTDVGNYLPDYCLDCINGIYPEFINQIKSLTNGTLNTSVILSNPNNIFQPHWNNNGDALSNNSLLMAAQICANYSGGGYNDWYLPAILEMKQLVNSQFVMNEILGESGKLNDKIYVTSSGLELSGNSLIQYGRAYMFSIDSIDLNTYFTNGYGIDAFSSPIYVRAFRRF
jgi:hypothetical protein